MSTTYENIVYNVADRVARITLNRPEKRNALSFDLRKELVHALRTAEADDSVTVILIDAAPVVLQRVRHHAVASPGRWKRLQPRDSRSARGLGRVASLRLLDRPVCAQLPSRLAHHWDLLKPVVAKVHGHCLAGGTELMSM